MLDHLHPKMCIRDSSNPVWESLSNTCIELLSLQATNRYRPVSYTHLDVYKRQDVDGHFELAGLRNGTSKLIISYVSYCTQIVEVTINGMFEIKVELEQDTQQLGEVVVVADAKKNTENAIITPVSYTHLDVYKRQAIASVKVLHGCRQLVP